MELSLAVPAGRKFSEVDQKLGAIGFFVPYDDFSGWAVQYWQCQIINLYAPVEKRVDRAAPTRKEIKKTGTEESMARWDCWIYWCAPSRKHGKRAGLTGRNWRS